MTDIHLLEELTNEFEKTFPNDVEVTLASFGGQMLTFDAPIEVANNSWEAGVVEFLDGDCEGVTMIIAESQSQTVYITSPFFKRKPAPGDTVRISGGPLKLARVYNEDPESIKEAVDSGVKHIITANVLSGGHGWKGFGGRSHRGVEATSRILGFEISIETKHITGLPTAEDLQNVFVTLPILKEQVVSIIHAFRADPQNRLSGEGDIEYVRGYIQRPGYDTMRGYVIEFDMRVN